MKPRRTVLVAFLVVFNVAAVYLLYEGATSGNYLLVAAVAVAYVFVLMLEASLSSRATPPARQPSTKRPAKGLFVLHSSAKPNSNGYL